MDDTMRRVFNASIDREFEKSASFKTSGSAEVIVKDTGGKLLLLKRNEFREDQDGVTIGEEFIIMWSGITKIESTDDILKISLNDNTSIEVEAVL